MCLLAVVLVVAVVSAQSPQSPDDCEENGSARVKFAQLRTMEDEELDLSPYLDVPVDYEVGRAKPMAPLLPNEPSPSPKPSKKPVVSPKVLVNAKAWSPSPKPATSPNPEHNLEYANDPSTGPKDWYPELQIPAKPKVHDNDAKPKPPTQNQTPNSPPEQIPKADAYPSDDGPQDEDPDEGDQYMEPSPEPEPKPEPEPVAPIGEEMPPGVQIAGRVDGSVVAQVMQKQQEDAYNEALERARQAALEAMSPSPSPVSVDDNEVELPPMPDVGLGPTLNEGPGVPPPAPRPSTPPSSSATPTPSASLEVYFPTIEHEVEDCDEPPQLPESYSADDIVSGDYPISQTRGQILPVGSVLRPGQHSVLVRPQDFEVLPEYSQEYRSDSEAVSPLVPTYHDDSMLDSSKYQTFSLSDKYDPVPGDHIALRRTNLAGDDMGSYTPSLKKLDYIRSSASHLAGKILRKETPLHDSDSPEEYRSNELALNVTWALMNEPAFPHAPQNLTNQSNQSNQSNVNQTVAKIADRIRLTTAHESVYTIDDKFEMNTKQYDHVQPSAVPAASPAAHTPASVPGLSDPSSLGSVIPSSTEYPVLTEPTTNHGSDLADVTHPEDHYVSLIPGAPELSSEPEHSPEPVSAEIKIHHAPRYQMDSDNVPAEISTDTENKVKHNMPEPNADVYEDTPVLDVPQVPQTHKVTHLGGNSDAVRISGIMSPNLVAQTMPAFKGLDLQGMEETVRCQNSTDTSDSIAEVATMTPEFACAARVGCGECVIDQACVWCPLMSACVEGGADGPHSVSTCQDYLFAVCNSAPLALRPLRVQRSEAYVDHEVHWHRQNEQ